MKRAYLDTEFTCLNRYRAKLISLALVVPGDSEFYVELGDVWEAGECSDFVREIVLPQLEPSLYSRSLEQARVELLAFLRSYLPLEIISDAPDWDWPMLQWLLGSALPTGVVLRQIPSDIQLVCRTGESPHHALKDARLLAAWLE